MIDTVYVLLYLDSMLHCRCDSRCDALIIIYYSTSDFCHDEGWEAWVVLCAASSDTKQQIYK